MITIKTRKVIFSLSFIILGVVIIMIMFSQEKNKLPTISQIKEDTKIPFPENGKLLFFRNLNGLKGEVIYIKLRMNRNDWGIFSQKTIFKDIPNRKTDNIFLKSTATFSGWQPQSIKDPISGLLNIDDRIIVKYLFDLNNPKWVDTYFEVGIE